MRILQYTIECHDVNGLVFKRETIKANNEADGLAEARAWAKGTPCAFFTVRAKRGVICDSRKDT